MFSSLKCWCSSQERCKNTGHLKTIYVVNVLGFQTEQERTKIEKTCLKLHLGLNLKHKFLSVHYQRVLNSGMHFLISLWFFFSSPQKNPLFSMHFYVCLRRVSVDVVQPSCCKQSEPKWCFPQLEFSCQARRDHGQVSHTERSLDSVIENGSGFTWILSLKDVNLNFLKK